MFEVNLNLPPKEMTPWLIRILLPHLQIVVHYSKNIGISMYKKNIKLYARTHQLSIFWNCKNRRQSYKGVKTNGTGDFRRRLIFYPLAEWKSWRRSRWEPSWWRSSQCRGPCASVSSWLFSTWRSCPLPNRLCNCGKSMHFISVSNWQHTLECNEVSRLLCSCDICIFLRDCSQCSWRTDDSCVT